MELAEKGIKASDILTKEALLNAIRVHAATGGSTNALLHLPAIAHELNIEISYADFEEANAIVPYLTNIQPSGSFLTEFFWFSGGVPRVQWEIQDLLHLDVMTVTGKTLKENLEDLKREGYFERTEGWLRNYKVDRKEVIREAKQTSLRGSIAILKGSLAPEGAVVKFSAVTKEMMVYEGPAAVFNQEEEALRAILEKRIMSGDVIIIRYEGPRGTGMPEMLATTEALITDPVLSKTTALITDGRYSGPVEILRASPAEAGVDRRLGPGAPVRGGARPPRDHRLHVPLGRDSDPASRSAAAGPCRGASGPDRGARAREPGGPAARIAATTHATLLRVEGGWYAVLQVPATETEEERVVKLLAEDGVLVHPGYFFDFPREAYLVVSLLPPEPTFADGLGRLLSRL